MKDIDPCVTDAIKLVGEQRELNESESDEMYTKLSGNHASMWQYLGPAFDPDKTQCTYTCVWQAFESFYDTQCSIQTEAEDRTNACVKWLHDLQTKIQKLEQVDDLVSPHPFSQFRDRFAQLKQRVEEITEFVMHKFRCSKFGV